MLLVSRFRLYPTLDQERRLAVQFGHARWVWNDALALTQRAYRETGKGLGYHALATRLPDLKQKLEWLRDADSQVLQSALQNLASAFDNFFQKRACYPRFKSKHGRQSIQYPQRVKIDGKCAYLPKVGWIKIVAHRALAGRIKTVTISRDPCGHHYAAILTEDDSATPEAVLPKDGRFTGIDVGLTDFAVTGDGSHFHNPRHLKLAEKNIVRKQRKLSRKQKGSQSREKARRLVARAHERVKNTRKDYLHKLSRKLVDKSQAIAVEDLNVKAMMRNRSLAKAIGDAGWGMFTNFLRYKAQRAGKFFVRVDRFFPSSKTCSVCGHRRTEMPLSTRKWVCEGCGVTHDRDQNAAANIGQEADRMFRAGRVSAPGAGAAAGGGSVSRRKRLGAARARPREAGSPRLWAGEASLPGDNLARTGAGADRGVPRY